MNESIDFKHFSSKLRSVIEKKYLYIYLPSKSQASIVHSEWINICFIRCSILQDYVDNYDEHSFFHRDYRDILCWGIGLNESLYYKKTRNK